MKNFYAKTFFSFSLRTHLISEARRRAAIAARFTDDLIGLIEMCGADMLNEQQMDAVVDDLLRFEVTTSEALRETCGPRGLEAVTAAIRLHEATRETLRAALIYNDYKAVSDPLNRTLERLGLTAEPGGQDWLRAARRAARSLLEVADENIHREQGIYRTDDRLVSMSHPSKGRAELTAILAPLPVVPAQTAQMAAHASHAAPGPMQSPPETSPMPTAPLAPTLAKVAADPSGARQPTPAIRDREAAVLASRPNDADNIEETRQPIQYINTPSHDDEAKGSLTAESRFSAWFEDALERKREENPGRDTNNLSNWRSTRKLFIEAHGDRPMSFYTKDKLLEFRALLCAMPKNHHKSSDSPGLYTIIDEAEIEEARNMISAENEITEHSLNRGDAEQRRVRAKVERVRVATAYRHMQAVQFVFRNAADHAAAPVNAMKGVIWTTKQLDKLQAEEKDMKRLPLGRQARRPSEHHRVHRTPCPWRQRA